MSSNFFAALAYSGAKALQCPHHGASVTKKYYNNIYIFYLTKVYKTIIIQEKFN